MNNKNKEIILDFIKKYKLAVISTINSENKPESAVMAFSETENLELIFQTPNTIGAGFVRSKVWDYLHEFKTRTPLPDIDFIYFDKAKTDE